MASEAFDLAQTYIHLARGGHAIELPDFSWSAEYMREYLKTSIRDGADGRLVGIIFIGATWTHWECHTGGDELVVQLTGSSDVVQDIDGELHTLTLTPGLGMINPRGVWHTSNVHEPGQSLFVGSGGRTLYRPRDPSDAQATAQPA